MGLSDRMPPSAEEYAVCRERLCIWGRWEFQYVRAPLVLRYGTGSPVNPLAIL